MGENRKAAGTSSIDVIKRRRKRKKKIITRVALVVMAVLLVASVTASVILGFSWNALKEKNATYKDSYAQLQTEIGELKTKVAEANNLLTSLKEKVEATEAENSDLKQRVEELETENADLKAKQEQTGTGTGNGGGTSSETDEPQEKIAYLTFDDGCSKNTPTILDTLDKYGVKATFFVNWKSGYKDYYRLIVEGGHALGNHTLTHEWDAVYTDLDGFIDEVKQLEENIYELTGYKTVLFRFPGGTSTTKRNFESFSGKAIKAITDMGYIYFDWNVDSRDADGKKHTADEIASNVLSGAKNKSIAIILMHDTGSNKQSTVDALPKIIEGLLDMGFKIEALSSSTTPIQFKPS